MEAKCDHLFEKEELFHLLKHRFLELGVEQVEQGGASL